VIRLIYRAAGQWQFLIYKLQTVSYVRHKLFTEKSIIAPTSGATRQPESETETPLKLHHLHCCCCCGCCSCNWLFYPWTFYNWRFLLCDNT